MGSRILAVIPARAGSKGLPRKNIRPVGGIPLVCWTWMAARSVPAIDRLIVTTDDPEVVALARDAGVEVPFLRPPHLASDTASAFAVAEHALGWLDEDEGYRPDVVVWLQPTSPLRSAEDIAGAIAVHEKGQGAVVVGVCSAEHHPFWSVGMDQEGVLFPLADRGPAVTRRQDLPDAYRINGAIYVIGRDLLLAKRTFEPEPTIGYVMPIERSIDVDSAWDLHVADLVMKERLAIGHARSS